MAALSFRLYQENSRVIYIYIITLHLMFIESMYSGEQRIVRVLPGGYGGDLSPGRGPGQASAPRPGPSATTQERSVDIPHKDIHCTDCIDYTSCIHYTGCVSHTDSTHYENDTSRTITFAQRNVLLTWMKLLWDDCTLMTSLNVNTDSSNVFTPI